LLCRLEPVDLLLYAQNTPDLFFSLPAHCNSPIQQGQDWSTDEIDFQPHSGYIKYMSEQQNNPFASVALGIVCPMANERDTVERFIPAVLGQCRGFRTCTFFAVLDRASTDGTVEIVRSLAKQIEQLTMIWAPENRCVVDAYLRGYREALAAGCDWILEIDAGFSHRPQDIPRFFEAMKSGCDCVFGSRFCPGGVFEEAGFKRRLISRGGTVLTNLLLGTKLKDMTSGFELFSRSALEMVLAKGIHSRAHFFQTEIKVFCRHLRCVEVPITYSNPSSSVNGAVLGDAFFHLGRLFMLRLKGQL